jgi:hypothetical protein
MRPFFVSRKIGKDEEKKVRERKVQNGGKGTSRHADNDQFQAAKPNIDITRGPPLLS